MARRVASPRFVGRRSEATSLEEALSAAEQHRPSITLVAGEAGVGKTRLLREVGDRVRDRGARVLRGECIELSGGEFPYAPVVGALRDAGQDVLADPVASLASESRAELARLVPEIGRWVDEPPSEAPRASSQGRLFELLLVLLRELGEEAPLLFVVEDAHWADTSTRDFLSFLARNLSAERVAIVVTYRLDDLGPDHPLRALVSELIRCDPVEILAIERLSRVEVERLLEYIVGEVPPLALVDEVFARSGGNPFFAEELLATPTDGDRKALPESLRDALLLRVEALPPESVDLLERLAVLGRPADDELLGELSGIAEPDLSASLRPALSAHIVARRAPDNTFDFRHALVREALSGELLPAERSSLHGSIAETLMRTGAGTPAELAYHWHGAGQLDAALAASVEAGLDAEQVYASAEARQQFERAVKLWKDVQPAPGSLSLDHVDVLRHAAEAARLTGDWDEAATLCREALSLLDPARDPLRAAILHERLGEYLANAEAALGEYSKALSLLPVECGRERARILAAKALALHFLQRWNESRACAEEALAMAQEAGGRSEEGYARNVLGLVLGFLGDPTEGERQVREAKRIADEIGVAEDEARAYAHLAEVLRLQGRIADAFGVMLEGEKLAARMGMTGSFGHGMSLFAAEDLMRLGRWHEAEERLRWTARLNLGHFGELLQHSLEGRLAAVRGETETASSRLTQARAMCDDHTLAEYLSDVHVGFAELALWGGRPDEARSEIAEALRQVEGRGDPLYTPVLFWLGVRAEADAATAARAQGREREEQSATDLIGALEQLIARSSIKEAAPEALAYLTLCRAEQMRLAGAPAAEAWAEAAAAWERLDQPYQEAYARWREAEALLVAGQARAQAAAVLGRAREAALQLGAGPLMGEIEALARAARLELSHREEAEAAEAEPPPLGLTARELEVLGLIAEGCTNPQIAERLFISQKTASVHVSHILGKLGAENRVQAAGIAHRLGLLDTPSGES
jgi:DNA-binding CsgD family transcriptional regulator/tetratricopeptide (TPR) repeat protein